MPPPPPLLPPVGIADVVNAFDQPNSRYRTPPNPVLAVDRGGGETQGHLYVASNFMPAVGVAPDGRVDVAFYDRRDDPGNRLLTAYLASSYDAGLTWVNARASDAQFDGDLSRHQDGRPFLGDYIGVADLAIPIWADTRHGRSDAYVTLLQR